MFSLLDLGETSTRELLLDYFAARDLILVVGQLIVLGQKCVTQLTLDRLCERGAGIFLSHFPDRLELQFVILHLFDVGAKLGLELLRIFVLVRLLA